MLSTVLVPIIKDKTGRIDRMDNYRPIALASVMSKVVEIIILHRISKLLSPCSNQFGFQQKLGTDTRIYILKEIVEKYRSLTDVYVCVSLMLSKRLTGSSTLYYSLSLCDVVSLDILLDCYAIGMADRLCVSDGAIHYQIPFT